jgi:membrane associated rhomboid family serine protease
MAYFGVFTIAIIVANVIVSYIGFKDRAFFEKYCFEVEKVLVYKEYWRMITSGFLHVGWGHLLFNMFALYTFRVSLETYLQPAGFLTLYFASLLGADLLSLIIHKQHGDYSAVGASGAVCGVIFASIALFPDMQVGFFGLPFGIPGWIYGIIYVLYSMYAIRSKRDNIGHEAHLGGALAGILAAVLMARSPQHISYPIVLTIVLPSVFFIYMIITRPHVLLIDNFYFKKHSGDYDIDDRYNIDRIDRQKEIDILLEKIHKNGLKSLSKRERELLEKYSQSVG